MEFLTNSDEQYKPFKYLGFTIGQVSDAVAKIYDRHSTDINTVYHLEGRALEIHHLLTDE